MKRDDMNDPLIKLTGKRGLILGIANEHSIAFGCARVMRGQARTEPVSAWTKGLPDVG